MKNENLVDRLSDMSLELVFAGVDLIELMHPERTSVLELAGLIHTFVAEALEVYADQLQEMRQDKGEVVAEDTKLTKAPAKKETPKNSPKRRRGAKK